MTLYPPLSTWSTQEDRETSQSEWIIVDWDVIHQQTQFFLMKLHLDWLEIRSSCCYNDPLSTKCAPRTYKWMCSCAFKVANGKLVCFNILENIFWEMTIINLYFCSEYFDLIIRKVSKKAKIRNWYNQVPHLTLDTTWESDKTQENIIYQRAKRSALYQQVITRLQEPGKKAWQTRNINNKNDPKKKHRLGTVS